MRNTFKETKMKKAIEATGKFFARAALAAVMLALAGSALVAQSTGFRFRRLLDRVITPNGDNKNDVAVFCVDNPNDSGVAGSIYDMKGRKIADMAGPKALASNSACPSDSVVPTGPGYMTWDGTANGAVVQSGVYVYVIRAEGKSFSGTVVVAR